MFGEIEISVAYKPTAKLVGVEEGFSTEYSKTFIGKFPDWEKIDFPDSEKTGVEPYDDVTSLGVPNIAPFSEV